MEFLNQIPQELKLPIVVAVGLAGFVAVLGASSLSVVPDKLEESEKVPTSPASSSSSEETEVDKEGGSPAPKTPKRSSRAKKEDLGTFTSPEGRRLSRRLQNKQKDQ